MKRTMFGGVLVCVLVLGLSLVLRAASSVPAGGILVSPSTLVMGSQGVWVTVHADIPYKNVNCATVSLNGIPVTATFADNQGDLVAKFQIDAIKGVVDPPSADVTLTADTTTIDDEGSIVVFTGTATIRVIEETGR